MAEKWRLEGTLFDACNCLTLCPCNYVQTPTQSDCRFLAVWRIEKGNYGASKLDGLHLAWVGYSKSNPVFGIDKSGLIIDEKATPEQREAIMRILGGQAGGMFAMLSQVLKSPPEVTSGKFEYANDGKSWSVNAGNALDVKAGFVKPPPGFPLEATAKKAQTYDPLFSPSMEKVVGITEHYRANAAGLNYDISGRYSSSGRFTYEGP